MPARLRTPDALPAGVWQGLLQHAYSLIDEIAVHGIQNPFWTFGGGTVLMLRYRHRMSKDIDIFVPDPQYLGFVSPRLSDVAEAVSDKYVEGPGYIKLIRPEGEIDFVASSNLTDEPFEEWELLGRRVKVETSAEIVAKKLWHRGDRATARDLFDLATRIFSNRLATVLLMYSLPLSEWKPRISNGNCAIRSCKTGSRYASLMRSQVATTSHWVTMSTALT